MGEAFLFFFLLGTVSFAQDQTVTSYTVAGANTFTAPAGCYYIKVEVWGAGGGGGTSSGATSWQGSGGGGGGGYSMANVAVTPYAVYNLYVGTGGPKGATNSSNGTDGEDSWFNLDVSDATAPTSDAGGILAEGGKGGSYDPAVGSYQPGGDGGAGGSSANGYGDVKYSGGAGAYGWHGAYGQGGPGGTSAGNGSDGVYNSYGTYNLVVSQCPAAPDGGGNGGEGGSGQGGLERDGGDGEVPGGGGGGAGAATGSPGNFGGDGANGKVQITYGTTLEYNYSAPWTAPAGITQVIVEAWGAGGGGAAGDNSFSDGGAGGGGGGYSLSTLTVVPATEYTVVVGLGGTGGPEDGAGTAGTDGGDSWFASSTASILAKGGTGGTFSATGGTAGTGGAAGFSVGANNVAYAGGDGGVGENAAAADGGGGGSGAGSGGAGNNGTAGGSGSTGGTQTGGGDGGVGGFDNTDSDRGNASMWGAIGQTPGGGGGGGSSGRNTSYIDVYGKGGDGGGGRITLYWSPAVTVGDNAESATTDIAASTSDELIHGFTLTTINDNECGVFKLTDFDFVLTGNYETTDITQFELWYNTVDNFGTATVIGTDASIEAEGVTQSFTGMSQTFENQTSYFWITMDVSASAEIRALTVSATASTDVTITHNDVQVTGIPLNGSAAASGKQSFVGGTPGGVLTTSDLYCWYMADEGITGSPTVTAWGDVAGNSNLTAAGDPQLTENHLNYNPVVSLDGTGDYFSGTTILNNNTIDDITIFYVAQKINTSPADVYVFGEATSAGSEDFRASHEFNNDIRWHIPEDDALTVAHTDTDWAEDLYFMHSYIGSSTAATGALNAGEEDATYLNGKWEGSSADHSTCTGNSSTFYLGADKDASPEMEGYLAELFMFDQVLTDLEMIQVRSYLALKYGFTLDNDTDANATPDEQIAATGVYEGDYVNSDGTIIWDASAQASAYHYDVAGIIRDDASLLGQVKSKSTNTDAILYVEADDEGTNATTTFVDMADKESFIWGNNNGNDVWTSTNAVSGYKKIGRTWYVQETGDVGACTFAFDVANSNFNVPGTGGNSYYLCYDSDANLDGGTQVLLYDDGTNGDETADDNIWSAEGVTMTNGTYFSIGAVVASPGGMDNAITWFRADNGIDNTVTTWYDQIGNNDLTPSGDPDWMDDTLNTHPVVEFDGTGDEMTDADGIFGTNTIDEITVFFVANRTSTNNVWFFGEATDAGDSDIRVSIENGGNHKWALPEDDDIDIANATSGWVVDKYNIHSAMASSDAARLALDGTDKFSYAMDGEEYGAKATHTTFTGNNSPFYIGANQAGADNYYGRLAEFFVYTEVPTDAELLQINTYLGIKYGITISNDTDGDGSPGEAKGSYEEGDYLATDSTVVWDYSTTTATYHNDIAGIARDDKQDLGQIKGTSYSTDAIFTIEAEGEGTNAANSFVDMADKEYFIWGNNNGTATWGATGTNAPAGYKRLDRVWRVEENDGDVGTCTFYLDVNNNSFNLPGTGGNPFYLVYEVGDTDFSAGATTAIMYDDGTNGNDETADDGIWTCSGINMADNTFFSVISEVATPGAMSGSMLAWWKADAGIIGDVTTWQDQGADKDLTVSAGDPTKTANAINYNPAVDFDGDDEMYVVADGLLTNLEVYDDLTIYYVATDDATDNYLFGETSNAGGRQIGARLHSTTEYWYVSLNTLSETHANTGWVADKYNVHSCIMATSLATPNGTGTAAYFDGELIDSDAYTTQIGEDVPFYLGAAYNGTANMTGKIAEFFVFEDVPSAQEKMQIDTYLAIKYGITVSNDTDGDLSLGDAIGGFEEGDYLATDGTVMWDYSNTTVTYHNDIAGIARDDDEGLSQIKSKSHSDDAILYVHADAEGTDNDLDNITWSAMADKEYFIWGNNNGDNNWTTTGAPGAYKILERQWVVEENDGDVGSLTFAFDVSDTDFNIPYAEDYYLVYDTDDDGSLADETPVIMYDDGSSGNDETGLDGVWTVSGINMADDAIFTLASAEVIAPGGVYDQLKIWTKADQGTNTVTDNGTIELWSNYGIGEQLDDLESFTGHLVAPTYDAAGSNYNPAIEMLEEAGLAQLNAFDAANASGTGISVFLKIKGTEGATYNNDYDVLWALTEATLSATEGSADGEAGIYVQADLTDAGLFHWSPQTADINDDMCTIANDNILLYKWETGTSSAYPYFVNGKSNAVNAAFVPEFIGNNFHLNTDVDGQSNNDSYDYQEVIAYEKQLDATAGSEQDRVHTYLAIKYGITLDNSAGGTAGDYYDTDGDLIWNADDATVSTYHYDVAGIGRDDAEALGQVKSKSQNSDAIVYIEADGEGTNLVNSFTDIADQEYFMWGNNNGSVAWTKTNAPTTEGYSILERVWRVEERTGSAGDDDIGACTFAFDVEDATFDVGSNGISTFYLVYKNASTDFSAGATIVTLYDDGTNGDSVASDNVWSIEGINMATNTYFTLAADVIAPGGVSNSLELWMKPDDETVGNFVDATGWADSGPFNRDFTTVTSDPEVITAASGKNFNKMITYDGGDRLALATITDAFTAGELFNVLQSSGASNFYASYFGGHEYDYYDLSNLDNYFSFGTTSRMGWRWTDGTPLDGTERTDEDFDTDKAWDPDDWQITNIYAGSNSWGFSTNAYLNASTAENTVKFTGGTDDYLGHGYGGYFTGNQGDVILYSAELSLTNRQKVNTYLAIKYGITLTNDNDGDTTTDEVVEGSIEEGDYVDTDGTIIWDASVATATYHNNVAGIGRDDAEALNQKQSKSENSDAELTIGIGEIATDNASNANTFTADTDYLIWGCNGATGISAAVTAGATADFIKDREWYCMETGTDYTDYDLKFDIPGNAFNIELYIDDDGDFSNATISGVTPVIAGKTVTFSGVDLDNGDFFTIGYDQTAPGGVANNLELWLQPDDETVGNFVDGIGWEDISGNDNHFTDVDSDPEVIAAASGKNFNKVAYFDSDDHLNLASFTGGFTAGEVYASVQQVGTGSQEGFPFNFSGHSTQAYNYLFDRHYVGFGNTNRYAFEWGDGTKVDHPEGGTGTWTTYANTAIDPTNFNIINIYSQTDDMAMYSNSYIQTLCTDNTVSFAEDGTNVIGESEFTFDGYEGDIILYSDVKTTTERAKINTYLAIKYGITMGNDANNEGTTDELITGIIYEGDYVDTDGNIIWDASVATDTYHNDIAGIGRDDAEGLGQVKSKSENDDAILYVEADGEGDNETNSFVDMVDLEYFIWGNNSGAATFSGVTTSSDYVCIGRTWYVQESTGGAGDDDVGDCTFAFDVADSDFDVPLTSGNPYYLVYETGDSDFSTGTPTEVRLYDDGTNGDETADDNIWSVSGVNMPTNTYFTIAALVPAPGGVSAGLKLWFKADYGVTLSGTDVTAWANGPTGESFTSQSTTEPVYSAAAATWNFNPYITFGDDGLEYIVTDGEIFANTDEVMGFFAVNKSDDSQGTLLQMGEFDYPAWEVNLGGDAGEFGIDPDNTDFEDGAGVHTTQTITTGENTLITSGWNNTTGGGTDGKVSNYKNGAFKEELSSTSDGTQTIGNATGHDVSIGANDDNDQDLEGSLPEVIVYNEYDLTATQIQQINTYLAIKYGVTLDQSAADLDYLDSEGTTIWDASTNTTYKNDIAGIGRDDAEALSQIKSKSVNSDAIITILAHGEGTDNNIDNITWSAMDNEEYFIWGNDGGAITFTETNAAAGTQKITRTWKVQESTGDGDGDVGAVTFMVDVDDAQFNIPELTCGASSYILMYDSDVDLAGGTVVTLYDDGATAGDETASDGIWTNNTVNMPNGSFFSIGEATSFQWDGGGGDDNWTTAANWANDVAPVAGDAIVFAGSVRTTPNNDFAAGTTFAALDFDAAASDFTIGGNDFIISSAGCTSNAAITGSNTANTMTINNNITFSTNAPTITTTSGGAVVLAGTVANGGFDITVNSGGTGTISGVVSGTGGITKSGTGSLTLSGANTYFGGLTLSAGTLNLNHAQAIGATSSILTIAAGTTIDASSGDVDMSARDNPITMNGDFTFTGTNNLDLGDGTTTMGADVTITTSTAAKALTLGGIIGDGASGYTLSKSGDGTLTLNGTNTFTDGVTLNAGLLNIGNVQALGTVAGTFTIAGGTIDNTSGGALATLNYPQTWSGDFTFTGTNDLDLGTGAVAMSANRQVTGSASVLTVGGIISGAFSLTKAGAGALTLEGTNTFTGGVTLSAGTLNISNAQALGTTAGTFTIEDGTTINNITGGAFTVTANNPMAWNGDFTFTGSSNLNLGTGTITMGASRQVTTSANTLTVGGTLTAASYTLTSAGAGGLAFESQAVTLSGLAITAGTLTSTSGNLSLAGDFDNDATFTHNNGTVTFNGAVDQNVGTSAGTQTFYDLTINNTGADGSNDIILADPVTVTNDITFTDGIVNTDATNLLTLSNAALDAVNGSAGGASGSYVNGPVKWNMTTAIGGPYIFPTGAGSTKWARLALSGLTGDSEFTVQYFNTAYADVSTLDTDDQTPYPNNVSNIEYWDITQNSGTGDATVTLYWEDSDASGIDECANPATDLMIVHFTSGEWRTVNPSTYVTTGGCSSSNGTIISDLVTSFSPFTFGSRGGANNPLPIELLSFDAMYNGTAVDLTWSTATEINNNYFTIERSTDGINFMEIANVPSKGVNGNSTTTLNYGLVDADVSSGIYYYRLKQTDFNGNFEYSSIKTVTIGKNTSDGFEFNISPNPSGGQTIAALIDANIGDEVEITVYDMLGQFLFDFDVTVETDDAEYYPLTFPEQLAPGTYIISAKRGSDKIARRMVID